MTPLDSATRPLTISVGKPALDKTLTKEESFFVVDQSDITDVYPKDVIDDDDLLSIDRPREEGKRKDLSTYEMVEARGVQTLSSTSLAYETALSDLRVYFPEHEERVFNVAKKTIFPTMKGNGWSLVQSALLSWATGGKVVTTVIGLAASTGMQAYLPAYCHTICSEVWELATTQMLIDCDTLTYQKKVPKNPKEVDSNYFALRKEREQDGVTVTGPSNQALFDAYTRYAHFWKTGYRPSHTKIHAQEKDTL